MKVVLSPAKVGWGNLCKMLSAGLIPGAPSAWVSQDRAWPRRLDHPPRIALRQLHLNWDIPGMLCTARSRAYLWNPASFPQPASCQPRGQGSAFPLGSLGWGPSMPTPVAFQQNFLEWWNCSVSVLSEMEASSPRELLRIWKMVSMAKEQKF